MKLRTYEQVVIAMSRPAEEAIHSVCTWRLLREALAMTISF